MLKLTLVDKNQLIDSLTEGFNFTELKTLAARLGIDGESLNTSNKKNFIISLLDYLERRQQMTDLLALGKKQRPALEWPEIGASASSPQTTDAVTSPMPITTQSQEDQMFISYSHQDEAMINTARYFLHIEKNPDDNTYRGCVHQGIPPEENWAEDLQLQPDSPVTVKGQPYSLVQLVNALISFDEKVLKRAFDERGQLEIGQHLFAQTFGKLTLSLKNKLLQHDNLDIRVLCPDEHIASLPWVLLADKGVFLSAAKKWSVALASEIRNDQVELPPYPKILVIAPQPNGTAKTEAEAHIEELRQLLSWNKSVEEKRLQIAHTWEQFQTQVKSFQPELVYYYGHGEGEKGGASYLLFADQDQQLCKKTVADVARGLRKQPPQLAYINCFQGNVGGWLGVGQQLGHFIPAVITNRTTAEIAAARAQALAFWKGLLLEGLAPHEAVAGMRSRLVDDGMGLGDARWMIPVWHYHYCNWQTTRLSTTNPLERDPLWRLKLDRKKQISEIFYQIAEITETDVIPSLAYIWFGKNGQGVNIFHERLEHDLGKKLVANNIVVETIKPSWPTDFANPHLSFLDMYREWFEVQALEEIPYRIQKQAKADTLLYVCHQPVSPKYLNKKLLTKYLKWWDNQLVPLLKDKHIYCLLGISFLMEDTTDFHDKLSKGLDSLSLKQVECNILEELGCVSLRDLTAFLKFNQVPLSDDDKKRLLNNIMEKTHGNYEETLEELKVIANRGWELEEDNDDSEEEDDEW